MKLKDLTRRTNMTKEEKAVQAVIDHARNTGATINVHHDDPKAPGMDIGYVETTICVAFSDEYDAMEVAGEIEFALDESCDTGAGFGFRDLQLCRLLPSLR